MSNRPLLQVYYMVTIMVATYCYAKSNAFLNYDMVMHYYLWGPSFAMAIQVSRVICGIVSIYVHIKAWWSRCGVFPVHEKSEVKTCSLSRSLPTSQSVSVQRLRILILVQIMESKILLERGYDKAKVLVIKCYVCGIVTAGLCYVMPYVVISIVMGRLKLSVA